MIKEQPLSPALAAKIPALQNAALAARTHAHAPYSNYRVGAALLAGSGQIYPGCNIENSAFSPSLCAERTALAAAIAQGEKQFLLLAIAGGPAETPEQELDFCYPCGVCRQVLAEFCGEQFPVLVMAGSREYRLHPLGELLPYGFRYQPEK